MKKTDTPSPYILTVGLEVHAELKTATKMFCSCQNNPDEKRPNVNICSVCMGHPGTLPVINKAAVKHVLRMGSAVGGSLADFTEFDRKNYFYPDIPKGYQISQYQYPLVKGGTLRGVAITRIHLEEDTARSSHDKGAWTLVDFNRAGVPLMELVTEPVVHSAEEASAFAYELQLLLRTLGAGEANMEKGEMRVEANISVSKTSTFGTKVEVKNLNSFKSVEKAIAYEYKRQVELLESGGVVVQETRGFNESTGTTFSQRLKESSHDYRYFPDPDLPKLQISEIEEFHASRLRDGLPELPDITREKFLTLGIKSEDVEMILRDDEIGNFVRTLAEIISDSQMLRTAVNYTTSDIAGLRNKEGGGIFKTLTPSIVAGVVSLLKENLVSSRGAKEILIYVAKGELGTAKEVAESHALIQESNQEALQVIIDTVISQNPKVVAEYKAGKGESIKFLVGQGMKLSKGSANPQILLEMLQAALM